VNKAIVGILYYLDNLRMAVDVHRCVQVKFPSACVSKEKKNHPQKIVNSPPVCHCQWQRPTSSTIIDPRDRIDAYCYDIDGWMMDRGVDDLTD
jgi:hypothetical protein